MFGQAIIKVKEGDKSKMVFEKGEWYFRETMPDGHYITYSDNDTTFITKDVFIKNGKKDGLESRYAFRSKQKYAEINWLNGIKNGEEIHYNGNRTISSLLTYNNGELNGLCIVNWSEGAKRYKGYYKNGFRDSIWTYYDHEKSRIDSANYWLSKEFKYQNGKEVLISAWDKEGNQIISNGNGVIKDSDYYTTSTEFINGLKNGKQETLKNCGTLDNEKYYKDGLLIKEILYYDNNKVASISEWSYPYPPQIVTSKAWTDDIFYNKVEYEYQAVRNGHWIAYYQNGVKIYEGDYVDGKRTGVWIWNYKNGNNRINANYNKNSFKHFDTKGEPFSKMSNEYLTILNDGYWFLNQRLDTTTVVLSRKNNQTVMQRLVFHFDGQLKINSYLVCGQDIGESLNTYFLLADNLTIQLTDGVNKKLMNYKYKIVSANDNEIRLKRLKR